ncbi:MAG: hypothetical protein HUK20_14315 [Fibrobacter sp.]|nr:hypothetical protein [Fibrobacter sp.]
MGKYSFENMEIDTNVKTFEVFQVSKMPDKFLEVEFKYPKTPTYRICLPILEKYQGVDWENAQKEDVVEYIKESYNLLNPKNATTWNASETDYWQKHEQADKAAELFFVLNTENQYHLTGWMCRQCTDTSSVNSQAASRIRALKKDHGYHIATKDMKCDVCGKVTTHDILIRLPKTIGKSNKRYSIPTSLMRRIKQLFNYVDACYNEKYTEGAKDLVVDHKFPSTRWAAGENPNFATMTDDEIKKKFQLLTQQTNLQKERYCARCLEKGVRGDFFGIDWFYAGDEKWDGCNNSDENGCLGCPWYDLVEWKTQFNEMLRKVKYYK